MKAVSKKVISSTALVRDLEDFEQVTRLQPEIDYFLTENLALYQELSLAGVPVHGVWEHSDDPTRKQVILDATYLIDHWYKDLRGSLLYRGVNMGEALKFSVYYFLFEALSANSVANQFFNSVAPRTMYVPATSNVPAKYSLHGRSAVPEAILAFHAQTSRISVKRFCSKQAELNFNGQFARRLVPRPARRILRRLGSKLQRPRLSRYSREIHSLDEAVFALNQAGTQYKAVCASCFQNFLLFLPIAAALAESKRWATLLVHTVPSLDYEAALKNPDYADFIGGDQSPFSYLELYRIASERHRASTAFIKNLWRAFVAWQENYRGNLPALFANKNLTFQFEYLLKTLMKESCTLVDTALDVFNKTAPDVLLIGNGSEKDHTFAAVARTLQIPAVLIPHNRVWAYPEVYDFPVDYVAVQNSGTADFLKDIIRPRRTLVFGDLKKQLKPPIDRSVVTARKSSNDLQLLVLIGWISPGFFQFFDIGSFYNSIKNLLSQAIKKPDWKLIFRSHPRSASLDTINELLRQSKNLNSGQVEIESRSAEELIPQSDLVILFDYRSSPVITAWKAGIPVVYWRSSAAFYSPDDMLREDIFLTATSFSELENAVDRLTNDPEWRAAWIGRGYELAERFFADPDLPANNVVHQLEAILNNR